MANGDPSPRQEFEFSFQTEQEGKLTVKVLDRITVDDVFLHMVRKEVFSIISGETIEDDVNTLFKDFLLKERFTAGQN